MTRREQQETNWCWAAVSQMIGAHYYGLLTQRQIVINVLGAEYNQGTSDAQVRQAIAFAINNKYNVTTRNSLSYEKIQKYISTSKLMGIKMVWNSGGAHALVLSGYSADGKVTLVDPAANAGIERYSYSSLVAGTTSEEAKSVLTKAEQEEVKNHAGKWMITETAEHTVEPYYDILLEKREALSDCTRVVLVGSQPGMRQPVALGMDDETARIWISLGYQYPVMEKIPETQNVESGVYSFESVAEISDTYIEDSEVSTGAGVQSRSSMKYVAGIGIVLIGSILILSVLKKKKIKSED